MCLIDVDSVDFDDAVAFLEAGQVGRAVRIDRADVLAGLGLQKIGVNSQFRHKWNCCYSCDSNSTESEGFLYV